jgi:DNA sulfur modification protein DndC
MMPWILGYSGGKDSTAALQVVWLALRDLPPDERRKPVHVISTDTLVENPVVAAWVTHSLETMQAAATSEGLEVDSSVSRVCARNKGQITPIN